jgi:ABC-type lipoprotein export system ATPase subunit
MDMTFDQSHLSCGFKTLCESYPLLETVVLELGVDITDQSDATLGTLLEPVCATTEKYEGILAEINMRYNEIANMVSKEFIVRTIEIKGGTDKCGNAEPVNSLQLKPGDLLSIVGPTGSGKSRFLGDIEWLAAADTPSTRTVLLNGATAEHLRFGAGFRGNLIAQLSQTMSFVMDSTVQELLSLHCECRNRPLSIIQDTIDAANHLSGESFTGATLLTSLSGGQTRALMVADTALICRSPIVLIDEVENAGIDRIKAFNLLTSNDKIVLLATHDPILALMAPRRLCMRNGAMHNIRIRTDNETEIMSKLEELDSIYMSIRHQIRNDFELSIAPITSFQDGTK